MMNALRNAIHKQDESDICRKENTLSKSTVIVGFTDGTCMEIEDADTFAFDKVRDTAMVVKDGENMFFPLRTLKYIGSRDKLGELKNDFPIYPQMEPLDYGAALKNNTEVR